MKSRKYTFIKYVIVSLLIAGVDYSVFWVSQHFMSQLLARLILARTISIIVQYLLVNFKVFESKLPTLRTLPIFVLLVLLNGLVVSQLIGLLQSVRIPEIPSKIISELGLYLPNYWIMKNWVFTDPKKKSAEVKETNK